MDIEVLLPVDSAQWREEESALGFNGHESPSPCHPEVFDSCHFEYISGSPHNTELSHWFLNDPERVVETCETVPESLGGQNLANEGLNRRERMTACNENESQKQEPQWRKTRQARMERNRASAARSRQKRKLNAKAKQQRVDELLLSNRELTDYVSRLASRLAALRGDISSGTDIALPQNQHW